MDVESGESGRIQRDLNANRKGYSISTSQLTYKVVKRVNGTAIESKLLDDVTATAYPSQVLAVMGPSGAGKSTFLDAVAGRIDRSSLQGRVLVNGQPMTGSFKRLSGYVMQDDQLFPMLTVRETLMFSARLRLPGSMSLEEKRERVEMLIDELGLGKCKDTVIGNEEVRGVSGGERRRVSIGVDLIHDPSVLFLDEPTSGLDSSAALNVMQNLNSIAKHRGRTIVLTIHQPSFRILELVHNLLLLARGAVVYHGPYDALLGHLSDFGYPVPDDANAVEFALDLMDLGSKGTDVTSQLVAFQKAKQQQQQQQQQQEQQALGISSPTRSTLLPLPVPAACLPCLAPIPKPWSGESRFANTLLDETLILCDRAVRNVFRTPELLVSRSFLMVLMGLILGSVFFHAPQTLDGVASRASFFSFSLAFLFFTCTEALPIFLTERQIFIQETSRGAYRTLSYVLASTVVFVPFLFILAVIFSCIAYFMVGLVATTAAFFKFLLAMFLSLCVANSFVFFFAALIPNPITGNTVVMSLTAFFFLFSGYFISQDEIPSYWLWMNYLSTFKYPLQMLTLNEFDSLPSTCWQAIPPPPPQPAPVSSSANGTALAAASASGGGVTSVECAVTSADVLVSFSMSDASFWMSTAVMLGFFVGYRLLFLVTLQLQRTQRK